MAMDRKRGRIVLLAKQEEKSDLFHKAIIEIRENNLRHSLEKMVPH